MSNSDYGLTQIIEGIIKGLPLSNISPNSSVGIVFEIILGIILSIKDVTNAKYHLVGQFPQTSVWLSYFISMIVWIIGSLILEFIVTFNERDIKGLTLQNTQSENVNS
jgi:uncharacterized membrane protein YeaQ/YmgE (transglycosylase-associated protein family)